MGLFDEVKCELPLPKCNDHVFQTKDTPCNLDVYVIGTDATLTVEGDKRSFDGDIRFYDFEEPTSETWIEYRATFRRGECTEICILDDSGEEPEWNQVWRREG